MKKMKARKLTPATINELHDGVEVIESHYDYGYLYSHHGVVFGGVQDNGDVKEFLIKTGMEVVKIYVYQAPYELFQAIYIIE